MGCRGTEDLWDAGECKRHKEYSECKGVQGGTRGCRGKGGSRGTKGAIGHGVQYVHWSTGAQRVQGQCKGHMGVQGCQKSALTLGGGRDTRSCSWVQTNFARPSYFNKL